MKAPWRAYALMTCMPARLIAFLCSLASWRVAPVGRTSPCDPKRCFILHRVVTRPDCAHTIMYDILQFPSIPSFARPRQCVTCILINYLAIIKWLRCWDSSRTSGCIYMHYPHELIYVVLLLQFHVAFFSFCILHNYNLRFFCFLFFFKYNTP